MTTQIPQNKIPSAGAIVENSGGVIPRKERHWSLQKRLTPLTRASVNVSRHAREILLANTKNCSSDEIHGPAFAGKKTFLVARKSKGFFIPIGVTGEKDGKKLPPRRFSSLDTLKTFAKSLGRSKIRVGCIVSNVE